MQVSGIKKELQGLKKELVPESRPMNVLLRTKAKYMTKAEIDLILKEVPLNRIPTDVIELYLNRDLDNVNAYFCTSFESVADMSLEMFEKVCEYYQRSGV